MASEAHLWGLSWVSGGKHLGELLPQGTMAFLWLHSALRDQVQDSHLSAQEVSRGHRASQESTGLITYSTSLAFKTILVQTINYMLSDLNVL